MKALILLAIAAGLSGCAEFPEYGIEVENSADARTSFAEEIAFDYPAGRGQATRRPASMLTAPEDDLDAADSVMEELQAPGQMAETLSVRPPVAVLGTVSGLFGDPIAGQSTLIQGSVSVIEGVAQVLKGKGIQILVSTTSRQSQLLTMQYAIDLAAAETDRSVRNICIRAGVFCFYSQEYAALSIYDPAEYRQQSPIFVDGAHGLNEL